MNWEIGVGAAGLGILIWGVSQMLRVITDFFLQDEINKLENDRLQAQRDHFQRFAQQVTDQGEEKDAYPSC